MIKNNYILKALFGTPIISPALSWDEWKRRLDKGSEKVLKILEPIGKIITKGIAGLGNNYGTSSVPYSPRTVQAANLEAKAQKIRELQVEKTMPYLSPSNHIVAWTQGSFNPIVGLQKIAEWGPTALLASFGVDMLGFKYMPKAVKGVPATVDKGLATVGNKSAKVRTVARQIDKIINEGIRLRPTKTDFKSYDEFLREGLSGLQMLERDWLDRELQNPDAMVHYDFGNYRSPFRKGDGAFVQNGKLVPGISNKGQTPYIWWSYGGPWQNAHRMFINPELPTPTRYISKPKDNSFVHVKTATEEIGLNKRAPLTVMDNEYVTLLVDLSNASVIEKDPFGWWNRIKYTGQERPVLIGLPYVRWSQEGYLNEAYPIYPKGNPNQFFEVVKDVDKPVKGQFNNQGNGQYSLHFKTDRGEFRGMEKENMFSALAQSIPEGSIVSTWGHVSPGGYHAINRFGNQFGWQKVGERPGVNGPINMFWKPSETNLSLVLRPAANITNAERLGIPKGERNANRKHYTSVGRNYRNTIFGEESIPKDVTYVEPISAGKKFGESDYAFENRKYATQQYLKELNNRSSSIFSDKGVEDIKEYVSLLPDNVNPSFLNDNGLQSFYIRDYRLYLNDLGYKAGDLSDLEIAKLLTDLYNTLSKGQTGKLKGKLVFHSGPNFFDLFDFSHTGENTGNMGYLGPGNYFSTKPSVYGGIGNYTTLDMLGLYRYPRRLPYLITNIKATPVSGELKETGIVPEFSSPPREIYTDLTAKQLYIDTNIKPIIEQTKPRDMAILDDISVSPHTVYTNGVQMEFLVPRNSGIKSIFPHPSAFVRDADGNVTVNRSWGNPKINLTKADEVAQEYVNDRSITGPPVVSDGNGRMIWRKNRWSTEGKGLMLAKFRPDEPTDPHHITLSDDFNMESIPERTYFWDATHLPFKGVTGSGLGLNVSTALTPNLLYNAFRSLHWMEPKVQELGLQYLETGNLKPIIEYYKLASPIEKEQLSSIVRQPMFLNSDIPYRFYNDHKVVVKENSVLQREINNMTPQNRTMFKQSLGWASTADNGLPIIFNKKPGFLGAKVVGHEGNHAFLYRFAQPLNMQTLLERALPAEETKIVKGKEVRLTGNDKKGLGSAHLNAERGSTIHDARSLIIESYYKRTERYPSYALLNLFIDGMAEEQLRLAIKSTGAYGKEYAPLIKDFEALRECLKYAYKMGGKLNNKK